MIIDAKNRDLAFNTQIFNSKGEDLTKKYCIIKYNTQTKLATTIKVVKDKFGFRVIKTLNNKPKIIRLILHKSHAKTEKL